MESKIQAINAALRQDDVINIIDPERPLKQFISWMTSLLVSFILKLFSCTYLLPKLGRDFILQREDEELESNCKQQLVHSAPQPPTISQTTEEDPLLKRLHQLEGLVTELSKKPTKLPPEKEDMLHESMPRIKCIEYDLQKTKKALYATASKQMELAESLENLKEDKLPEPNHEDLLNHDATAVLRDNPKMFGICWPNRFHKYIVFACLIQVSLLLYILSKLRNSRAMLHFTSLSYEY